MQTNIVVDSGSTSMKWAIIHEDLHVDQYNTDGWNASLNTPFPELPPEINAAIKTCKNLYYYGAGASSEQKKQLITKALRAINEKLKIEVYSDLLAAARVLYGDNNYGIVSILGTGSNVAFYQEGTLQYSTPSLGYLLSDEGSGNKIGAAILKTYFYNTMPNDVTERFSAKYSLNKETLIYHLYQEPQANTYLAQFTPFLNDIDNQWKDALLMEQFRELVENKILPHKNFLSVPIGFVGSIAHVFRKQLELCCKKYDIHNIQIIANPIDKLIEYHKKKQC